MTVPVLHDRRDQVEVGGGRAFAARLDARGHGAVAPPPDPALIPALTRVDLSTGAVGEIPLPGVPFEIAVGDDAAYVRLPSTETGPSDTVVRVDAATGAITARADLGIPIDAIAATPDALWAVTTGARAAVLRLHPRSLTVLATAALPGSDETTISPELVTGAGGVWVAAVQAIGGMAAPRSWWVDASGDTHDVAFDPAINPALGIVDGRVIGWDQRGQDQRTAGRLVWRSLP